MPDRKREISPAENATVDEYLMMVPSMVRVIIEDVRRQKAADTRPHPSASLVDSSSLMTQSQRAALLDAIAALVDENLSGRSDMCHQFADLLNRALTHLKFPSRPVVGTAIYYGPKDEEIWRWRHAWVRIGDEVSDGNVDCLAENPRVPEAVKALSVAPYWGPITTMPHDRRLREEHETALPSDVDVNDTWWPDLKNWLDNDFLKL